MSATAAQQARIAPVFVEPKTARKKTRFRYSACTLSYWWGTMPLRQFPRERDRIAIGRQRARILVIEHGHFRFKRRRAGPCRLAVNRALSRRCRNPRWPCAVPQRPRAFADCGTTPVRNPMVRSRDLQRWVASVLLELDRRSRTRGGGGLLCRRPSRLCKPSAGSC